MVKVFFKNLFFIALACDGQSFDPAIFNYSTDQSYTANEGLVQLPNDFIYKYDGILYRSSFEGVFLKIIGNQGTNSISNDDKNITISLTGNTSNFTQRSILDLYSSASDSVKAYLHDVIIEDGDVSLTSGFGFRELVPSAYFPIQDIPSTSSGDLTYSPLSPNYFIYWETAEETTTKIEKENQDELSDAPTGEIPTQEPPPIPSNTVQIFSLSTRTAIYGNDISASLNMGGDANTPKKVMFRVKGPTMNFNGAKLANPWMDVWTRSNVQGSQWSQMFSSYDFGDHVSSSEYEDRSTGNPVEPLVVESITPSIVSCVINSETVGGTGNANVEVYSLDDDNTTSYFKSLSTRGYVTTDTMIGSLRLVGTGTKDIMFRVKGPSMNFSGSKLTDPNLAIYHKENDWAEIVKSSTFQQYDSQDSNYTNVTSSYTDRHTGNNLEPLVVYRLSAGTYSCVVSSDIANEEGSANLEIYDVSE